MGRRGHKVLRAAFRVALLPLYVIIVATNVTNWMPVRVLMGICLIV